MLNDALVIGIVLTLVFGAVVFYLYNRLSMAERKMGLVEGMLTDMRIMFDSAPMASGPSYESDLLEEFRAPGIPQVASGQRTPPASPVNEDTEYQQTVEQALEGALATEVAGVPAGTYRTLEIDEKVISPEQPSLKLSPDLESMTVKELTSLAKQRSVTIPAGSRRKDIIELLKKSDGSVIQGTPLAGLDGPEPPAGGASLETEV